MTACYYDHLVIMFFCNPTYVTTKPPIWKLSTPEL